jgi:hypothetical protein
MCRSIKTLFNFEPPVTHEEIRAASLQFVRKLSGFQKIAAVSHRPLHSLETSAPPKNRDEEAASARARAVERFG